MRGLVARNPFERLADPDEFALRQMLDAAELVAPFAAADELVDLAWIAAASRLWAFWIRNTIRKVTMVVPVLITSCHVSHQSKMGLTRPTRR